MIFAVPLEKTFQTKIPDEADVILLTHNGDPAYYRTVTKPTAERKIIIRKKQTYVNTSDFFFCYFLSQSNHFCFVLQLNELTKWGLLNSFSKAFVSDVCKTSIFRIFKPIKTYKMSATI